MFHVPSIAKTHGRKYKPKPPPLRMLNISQNAVFIAERALSPANNTRLGIHSRDETQYTCPSPKADCPLFPLDSLAQQVIAHKIISNGGRDRFPERSHHYFVHGDIYHRRLCAVDPVPFSTIEFQCFWNAPSIPINVDHKKILEEAEYRGVIWRLDTRSYNFDRPVRRGTTFTVNGVISSRVKYYATIRRHMDDTHSLVQLNAISTEDQLICEYWHHEWPTILIVVPNEFCDVPMRRCVSSYFSDYITQPTSTWIALKRLFSTAPKKRRWDVEIMKL